MNIIAQIETNAWTRKKILMFFGLILLIVAVLEIWSVNRLATYGEQINRLERSKAALKLENKLLEYEIAKNSSLSESEKYAPYLGFDTTHQVEYLNDFGLALNH